MSLEDFARNLLAAGDIPVDVFFVLCAHVTADVRELPLPSDVRVVVAKELGLTVAPALWQGRGAVVEKENMTEIIKALDVQCSPTTSFTLVNRQKLSSDLQCARPVTVLPFIPNLKVHLMGRLNAAHQTVVNQEFARIISKPAAIQELATITDLRNLVGPAGRPAAEYVMFLLSLAGAVSWTGDGQVRVSMEALERLGAPVSGESEDIVRKTDDSPQESVSEPKAGKGDGSMKSLERLGAPVSGESQDVVPKPDESSQDNVSEPVVGKGDRNDEAEKDDAEEEEDDEEESDDEESDSDEEDDSENEDDDEDQVDDGAIDAHMSSEVDEDLQALRQAVTDVAIKPSGVSDSNPPPPGATAKLTSLRDSLDQPTPSPSTQSPDPVNNAQQPPSSQISSHDLSTPIATRTFEKIADCPFQPNPLTLADNTAVPFLIRLRNFTSKHFPASQAPAFYISSPTDTGLHRCRLTVADQNFESSFLFHDPHAAAEDAARLACAFMYCWVEAAGRTERFSGRLAEIFESNDSKMKTDNDGKMVSADAADMEDGEVNDDDEDEAMETSDANLSLVDGPVAVMAGQRRHVAKLMAHLTRHALPITWAFSSHGVGNRAHMAVATIDGVEYKARQTHSKRVDAREDVAELVCNTLGISIDAPPAQSPAPRNPPVVPAMLLNQFCQRRGISHTTTYEKGPLGYSCTITVDGLGTWTSSGGKKSNQTNGNIVGALTNATNEGSEWCSKKSDAKTRACLLALQDLDSLAASGSSTPGTKSSLPAQRNTNEQSPQLKIQPKQRPTSQSAVPPNQQQKRLHEEDDAMRSPAAKRARTARSWDHPGYPQNAIGAAQNTLSSLGSSGEPPFRYKKHYRQPQPSPMHANSYGLNTTLPPQPQFAPFGTPGMTPLPQYQQPFPQIPQASYMPQTFAPQQPQMDVNTAMSVIASFMQMPIAMQPGPAGPASQGTLPAMTPNPVLMGQLAQQMLQMQAQGLGQPPQVNAYNQPSALSSPSPQPQQRPRSGTHTRFPPE